MTEQGEAVKLASNKAMSELILGLLAKRGRKTKMYILALAMVEAEREIEQEKMDK